MRAVLQSALFWVFMLGVVAALLTLAGVYTLAGLGWTFLSSGLLLFLCAYLLRLGMTSHG